MPELPEVEAQARKLRRWCAGREIEALELGDDRVLKRGAARVSSLAGLRIDGVGRRSKYLWWSLSDGGALVCHLRMTGEWVRGEGEGRIRARLRMAPDEALDEALDDEALDDPGEPPSPPVGCVAFSDQRAFAELWLLGPGELAGFFSERSLGPEPWPDDADEGDNESDADAAPRDGAWWAARMAGLRGPIKPALLRQDRVAGLGNIAAIEILWLAGIDPCAKVPALEARHWDAIAEAAPDHLARALEDALQEDFSYLSVDPKTRNPFRIYKRAGERCPRCEGTIARFKQSGRSTFWCPGCQLMPDEPGAG